MFRNACSPKLPDNASARFEEKGWTAACDTCRAARVNIRKIISRAAEPNNPSSSLTTAKIESVVAYGKKSYFCFDCPNPTPPTPPEPIAKTA